MGGIGESSESIDGGSGARRGVSRCFLESESGKWDFSGGGALRVPWCLRLTALGTIISFCYSLCYITPESTLFKRVI